MGGARRPAKLVERRRKAEPIPVLFWTTAMGFAKRSTHPTIGCLTGMFDLPYPDNQTVSEPVRISRLGQQGPTCSACRERYACLDIDRRNCPILMRCSRSIFTL